MQIGLGNTARHLCPSIEAELVHLRFELRAIGALAQNEEFCRDGGRQAVQGIDQVSHAFARNQVADIQDLERAVCRAACGAPPR